MRKIRQPLLPVVLIAASLGANAAENGRADVAVSNLPGGSGQGVCVERFSFEIGLGGVDVSNLALRFDFFDKKGMKFYSTTDAISLDGSEGGHYKELYVESSELCQEEISEVAISSAVGQINHKTVDLVKKQMIHVEKFVPLKVIIPDHK